MENQETAGNPDLCFSKKGISVSRWERRGSGATCNGCTSIPYFSQQNLQMHMQIILLPSAKDYEAGITQSSTRKLRRASVQSRQGFLCCCFFAATESRKGGMARVYPIFQKQLGQREAGRF